ncbi:MAG: zeta toxin family protein [Candidatus Marinimicrobia bacterium]|nr:zeta toxin family protein [Candidatus Neomarinimicrobiota bacterium]MBL7010765.1 zeta toxin family protein [Candidatus Neomarinimicrobiota bacterium]MBL7031170.1 zeta toxin family protein [Candidatus Neomarinimicrobiota bacterium]
MKKIYIIAGPNGAGKTTASYTFLPEIIDCNEFINADEIAKGLSPFNADKVGIKAGRLMLSRMKELLDRNETFAIETTLALKSYVGFIQKAKERGYEIILLFLSLNSVQLAIKRVETRVAEGGHDIPIDTIKRRYKKGLINFFNIYISLADEWFLIDNSGDRFQVVARGIKNRTHVKNEILWNKLKSKCHED